MKKRLFSMSMIAILSLAVFTSCNKEGVYNPKKKISSIAYTEKEYLLGNLVHEDSYMREDWKWDGKKLSQVLYTYSYDYIDIENENITFKYDGKQVIEINCNGTIYSLSYKKNKIDEITYSTFHYDYVVSVDERDDDKITKMTTTYTRKNSGDKKAMEKELKNMTNLLSLLGADILRIPIEKSFEKNKNFIHESKGQVDQICHFEYDDDNLVKFRMEWGGLEDIILYTYDNKTNPFYGCPNISEEYFLTLFSFSKNNPTSIIIDEDAIVVENEYDGNWLKKQTFLINDAIYKYEMIREISYK